MIGVVVPHPGPPAGRARRRARVDRYAARCGSRRGRGRQRLGAVRPARGVRAVALEVDRGIPAGRNAGVGAVAGELLFFLDDDARLAAPDALARVAARFAADPGLGMLQLRVRSSDGGPAPRDWVPRLRVGDPARSSDVTAVWEGAVAMRRTVFEQAGGWPEEFRFAHEGIDLAWRVMDAGLPRRLRGRHRGPASLLPHRAARLLRLLRRPQPRLPRPPQPAAPDRRPVRRRVRSAHAPAPAALARTCPRDRCAGIATGSASRAACAAACGRERSGV